MTEKQVRFGVFVLVTGLVLLLVAAISEIQSLQRERDALRVQNAGLHKQLGLEQMTYQVFKDEDGLIELRLYALDQSVELTPKELENERKNLFLFSDLTALARREIKRGNYRTGEIILVAINAVLQGADYQIMQEIRKLERPRKN